MNLAMSFVVHTVGSHSNLFAFSALTSVNLNTFSGSGVEEWKSVCVGGGGGGGHSSDCCDFRFPFP